MVGEAHHRPVQWARRTPPESPGSDSRHGRKTRNQPRKQAFPTCGRKHPPRRQWAHLLRHGLTFRGQVRHWVEGVTSNVSILIAAFTEECVVISRRDGLSSVDRRTKTVTSRTQRLDTTRAIRR